MRETGFVTDLGRGSTIACSVGIALGIGIPALLPGVLLMCGMLWVIDP